MKTTPCSAKASLTSSLSSEIPSSLENLRDSLAFACHCSSFTCEGDRKAKWGQDCKLTGMYARETARGEGRRLILI